MSWLMMKKLFRIINCIIQRGYWFNNVAFEGCRRLTNYKTFNTVVVNLGSTSAVHAFDYDDIGIIGGNWALNRNPLLGDYAILKNYSSFLKENGATIIVPLCPFSALAGSYDYLDDRYYTLLYPSSIPNYTYIHDTQVKVKWKNPILTYPLYAPFMDLWHLIVNHSDKMLSEEDFRKDAEIKMASWMHEFSIKDFSLPLSMKNRDAIEDAAVILKEIISYCQYIGATPVLVVPPVYHTLNEKFTLEAKSILFDQLLSQIENKSVLFLNYMNHEEFTNDRTIFKDSFLLNKVGAKKFTKKVLKDLNVV